MKQKVNLYKEAELLPEIISNHLENKKVQGQYILTFLFYFGIEKKFHLSAQQSLLNLMAAVCYWIFD